MNGILVFGVIAVVIASCAAAPACQDVIPTITKCATDNGMDMAIINRYIANPSNITITVEDLHTQCSQLTEYKNTLQCITDKFNQCSLGATIMLFPPFDKMFDAMSLMCNDSQVKLECVASISEHQTDFQTCILSQSSTLDYSVDSQQIICLSYKISLQCVVNIVDKCDAYTATVMEKIYNILFSSECAQDVVG